MAKPQFYVMSHLYEPWDRIKTAPAVTCWRHRDFEGRLPFSVNPSDKRALQKMAMPTTRAQTPVLISSVQANYSALPSLHVLVGCVDAGNSAASGWFVPSVLEKAQLCLWLSRDCSSSGRAQEFREQTARSSALWWKLFPRELCQAQPHPWRWERHLSLFGALAWLWLLPSSTGNGNCICLLASVRDQQFPALRRSVQNRGKSCSPFQQGKPTQNQGSHQIPALKFDNTVQKPWSPESAIGGDLDAPWGSSPSRNSFQVSLVEEAGSRGKMKSHWVNPTVHFLLFYS